MDAVGASVLMGYWLLPRNGRLGVAEDEERVSPVEAAAGAGDEAVPPEKTVLYFVIPWYDC